MAFSSVGGAVAELAPPRRVPRRKSSLLLLFSRAQPETPEPLPLQQTSLPLVLLTHSDSLDHLARRLTSTPATSVVGLRTRSNTGQLLVYFQIVEPLPTPPPPYDLLPPGGCPKVPVQLRPHEGREELPGYAPCVYKLMRLERKMEWLLPYEYLHLRPWKDVVVELNNTQLNLYAVPENAKAFRPMWGGDTLFNADMVAFRLLLTTETDAQLYRYCARMGVFTPANLVRLYLLQHAAIGAAVDYSKRPSCLRLRCETEQFLLLFPSVETMLEWGGALLQARDVALDLDVREPPKYRTVPRRRRRHTHAYGRRHLTAEEMMLHGDYGRERAATDTAAMARPRMRWLAPPRLPLHQLLLRLRNMFGGGSRPATPDKSVPRFMSSVADMEAPAIPQSGRSSVLVALLGATTPDEPASEAEDGMDDFDDDEADDVEADNVQDLELDDEDEPLVSGRSRSVLVTLHVAAFMVHDPSGTDEKWQPRHRHYSEARRLRHQIRCMTLLPSTELWAGKPIMCPTTQRRSSNVEQRVTEMYASGMEMPAGLRPQPKGRKTVDYLESSGRTVAQHIAPAARTADHWVVEYTVTSTGLIPRGLARSN